MSQRFGFHGRSMHGVILTRGIGRRHAIWESLKGARLRPDSCRDSVHQSATPRASLQHGTRRCVWAGVRIRAATGIRPARGGTSCNHNGGSDLARRACLPSTQPVRRGERVRVRGMDRLRHHVRLQLVHDRKWRFSIDDGRTRRGLEKESLRVQPDGHLAKTPHASAFGSALMHPYITTDYSESLLELITPATGSIAETLGFLDDLHRFIYAHLGDEELWVNSMPCILGDDDSIPLAQYGSSNIGRMKTLYRRGLGVRYGRRMQTIAGIHYNLSFPDSFWRAWQEQCGDTQALADFRSEKYFALVRNFQRQSWLLLYMLGASPAVCGSFLQGREHGLDSCGHGTLYLPQATSLRMSSLGYQNSVQSDLKVSYNGLNEYVRDLSHAIRTPCAPFEKIGLKDGSGEYQQISTNILQIENEYYGLVRPKRTTGRGERPTTALSRRGVEYVELRCVDLNPFNPIGIDDSSAHFLEVFALHCLLSESHVYLVSRGCD